MSSKQNGNEQEFVGSNDKKQQKTSTASVQILIDDGPTIFVKVELDPNCSTVAEHAAFLLENINKSRGMFGLPLNGQVELVAVFTGNAILINHNVPLKEDCNYTFRFKLAKVQEEEEEGPNPVKTRMKKQKENQATQLENRMANLDVTISQKKHELAQINFQLAELELERNARLANGGRQLKLANFWAVEASAPGVRISDGGLVAELSSNEVNGNVRAKFPLIKTRVPYFEVRIVAQKPVEEVRGMENQAKFTRVGLVPRLYSLCKMPVGGTPGSYSHSSSGNVHVTLTTHVCTYKKRGVKFDEDDTVGYGVKANGQLFFTLNGKMMERQMQLPTVDASVELFPAMTLVGIGTKVEANFGDDPARPFLFKLDSLTH